mgnify:CR=1 FL=1
MDRADLKVDTFYWLPNGEVFITPDAYGGWWYETIDEARQQHGDLPVIKIKSIPEF